MPFAPRGAGGSRRRQRLGKLTPLGFKRITQRAPSRTGDGAGGAAEGLHGPAAPRPAAPGGKARDPNAPEAPLAPLKPAVRDSSKFILFQYFCLHTMQVAFLRGYHTRALPCPQPARGMALGTGRRHRWALPRLSETSARSSPAPSAARPLWRGRTPALPHRGVCALAAGPGATAARPPALTLPAPPPPCLGPGRSRLRSTIPWAPRRASCPQPPRPYLQHDASQRLVVGAHVQVHHRVRRAGGGSAAAAGTGRPHAGEPRRRQQVPRRAKQAAGGAERQHPAGKQGRRCDSHGHTDRHKDTLPLAPRPLWAPPRRRSARWRRQQQQQQRRARWRPGRRGLRRSGAAERAERGARAGPGGLNTVPRRGGAG